MPNAGVEPPRIQLIKHSSLADESRTIRGCLKRLVMLLEFNLEVQL